MHFDYISVYFKDVWLSSENLTISDCELFLGYLGNLTFKYILTSGHAVPFQYSPKQDATAKNVHHLESEDASKKSKR